MHEAFARSRARTLTRQSDAHRYRMVSRSERITVAVMSVNIDIRFGLYSLAAEDAALAYTLFERAIKENQLERDVTIFKQENADGTRDVYVVSQHPVIFSGFYKWRSTFEESLQSRVAEAIPPARVAFDWQYPDE